MEEKSTPALKDITVTLATKESAVISGRTGRYVLTHRFKIGLLICFTVANPVFS